MTQSKIYFSDGNESERIKGPTSTSAIAEAKPMSSLEPNLGRLGNASNQEGNFQRTFADCATFRLAEGLP